MNVGTSSEAGSQQAAQACIMKVAICIKIDEICIKNDGFCTENDGFCTENDGFCIMKAARMRYELQYKCHLLGNFLLKKCRDNGELPLK